MNDAWILRFSHPRVAINRSLPVRVLRLAPGGEETELERQQIELGRASLRDLVKTQIAKGRNFLILDLAVITHLDSSGLGEIVSAYVHAGRANGGLVLACVPPRARQVIRVMGLEGVIPTYDSVTAAAGHFDL